MRRFIVVLAVAVLFAPPVSAEESVCDVHAKMQEARELMLQVPLRHGKLAGYKEYLRFPGAKPIARRGTDFSYREFPVALLDVCTCELKIEKVRREIRNGRLTPPLTTGVQLALEYGPFGDEAWNWHNTPMIAPMSHYVIIGLRWEFTTGETFSYTPPTRDLAQAFPWLAAEGRAHYERDLAEAKAIMRERRVPSKAFPGKLLVDAMPFEEDLRLILVDEATEPAKVVLWGDRRDGFDPFQSFWVGLGLNGNVWLNAKVSSAGAQGIAQVWLPSYGLFRDAYPEARLTEDFDDNQGYSHAHVKALVVEWLEFDYDAAELIARLGRDILEDPHFREYRFASYNTGPKRVAWALEEESKYGRRWDAAHYKRTKHGKTKIYRSLFPETVQYVRQYRLLLGREEETRDNIAATAAGATQ